MNKSQATHDLTSFQSPQERDAILRELRSIVESAYFCNSKRYPALLQFIVENALAGNAGQLKERTIGISVFDRPPTYDTNADTIVRYTAGEVRKRLLLYYSEHKSKSGLRISLPPGSYVPEFIAEPEPAEEAVPGETGQLASPEREIDAESAPLLVANEGAAGATALDPVLQPKATERRALLGRTRWLLGAALIVALVGLLVYALMRPRSVVASQVVLGFWEPVLRNQPVINICAGGVVFQNNDFSGVITADKDAEYPFVSMQSASAIAQISALADHLGASTRLLPSPSTQVSDLRDHPAILVGAYNNRWTMQLLQSAPYRFTAEPVESIIDQNQPAVHWTRDRSHRYGSADDYAVIARFHDATTGQWVIAIAGLGRNGTEAAALFATDSHGLQMLQDRVGVPLAAGKNVAAVLKVHVIDGRTGAASIEAAKTW